MFSNCFDYQPTWVVDCRTSINSLSVQIRQVLPKVGENFNWNLFSGT